MKKGKTFYLWLIIIFFIILWVPYFQNVGTPIEIAFFNGAPSFLSLYPWLLIFGVGQGALIVFYVQSLINDIKKDDPKKFDL